MLAAQKLEKLNYASKPLINGCPLHNKPLKLTRNNIATQQGMEVK